MKKAVARRWLRASMMTTLAAGLAVPLAWGQAHQGLGGSGGAGPGSFGPFDVELPAGGDGITKPKLDEKQSPGAPVPANTPFTLYGWVQEETAPKGQTLLGGFATADGKAPAWFLALVDGKPALVAGARTISGGKVPGAGQWMFLAASFDGGRARLYVDGREVASGEVQTPAALAQIQLGPRRSRSAAFVPANAVPFTGRLAEFSALPRALSADEVKALASGPKPVADLMNFESGAPTWPVQVRQMYGQVAPQDPWTRPTSKTGFSAPVAKPVIETPALAPKAANEWVLGAWKLAETPKLTAGGVALSQPGYDAKSWYAAVVPGTVLTTLVDRGVYPDPDYGLNNLAIPESLNKQDYWYRSEFTVPADQAGKHLQLSLNGVNYQAEVWLNGQRLGSMKGAFIRGRFDVTGIAKPGQPNALAIRVSPPPRPGIPHEESLTSAVGENGGIMALDGPTFVASEGWDWIPSVRDRNTGLWRDVTLTATGDLRLGDAQVVTALPKADNSIADISVSVPVENLSDKPINAAVTASFDGVSVTKHASIPAGGDTVTLAPAEFPQLSVKNPKLWWPNGYGEQALHQMKVSVTADGQPSDTRDIRFGIREVTYELSLMDQRGALRRVEVDLTTAKARGEKIIDVSHEGIRKVPDGWAASLYPGAENSPAVTPAEAAELSPHLVIRVNGVRIAARGGNWGTDDWRKRVEKSRLEPYFRLHRDAHVNVIRNWVGQNTEEEFFELADEYGLMVLNDFWASTQDYQLEPQDVPLFMANATDTVRRYRNHPSIVLWFGRNEGVPQPILNEALADMIRVEDGTRHFTGSSNRVNLAGSGPYNYREPDTYFTEHAQGFSVELGTPSFPTLEAFKEAVPASEQWPISDTWAYHDWHQTGNGATQTFMDAMAVKFGAATSLEDFERKAQMLNYEGYRAIFEGMNAGLWTRHSGRMLWMTQPAWPSTMWQILTHDYDTHGAFYGVKKASEPVHAQLDLPDHGITVVNNTRQDQKGLSLAIRTRLLSGKTLADSSVSLDAAAGSANHLKPLDLKAALAAEKLVLVSLELKDKAGATLSRNDYWVAADAPSHQRLNELPATPVTLSAKGKVGANGEVTLDVTLTNPGTTPALLAKLTPQKADGSRILPAYISDNYVTLLPGETRQVTVTYPAGAAGAGAPAVALRGWNIQPTSVTVNITP
ncbi:glycosyl hydrolase 2 galactose-binding domain-containing protein [Niveispirillum sp. KHB5.9]|uniref:glycosyl hydrolase 2 galactose-binding domain-containing protein n=1 Tax=Niveispirillum sp. KHB5.9 TaxID=3400269 RepID=UPI003A83C9CB